MEGEGKDKEREKKDIPELSKLWRCDREGEGNDEEGRKRR